VKHSRLIKFAFVGGIGFIVDALALHLLVNQFGLIGARVISFLVAVTVTWLLNRSITFSPSHRTKRKEWLVYTLANSFGALINFGCYAFLVTQFQPFHNQPVSALAIASLIAMIFNYMASKLLVFNESLETT